MLLPTTIKATCAHGSFSFQEILLEDSLVFISLTIKSKSKSVPDPPHVAGGMAFDHERVDPRVPPRAVAPSVTLMLQANMVIKHASPHVSIANNVKIVEPGKKNMEGF